MYWHPNSNYLAATVCDTYQNFFINNPNTLEVLDHNSDIVIYDVKKNEVFSCEALNSKDAWQIFPAFSPDGKSLYFSSTAAVDSISKNFRQMTYSLCRVGFDPETRTLGQQVDTLYNGRPTTKAYPSLESHRMVNIWLLPYRNMAVSGFGIKTPNYI